MIDKDGYRANVAMVLSNGAGQVLWARRCGMDAWQFPQGGIRRGESVEQAMYRELKEELGLEPNNVEILGRTADWLRYELPRRFRRRRSKPLCIGQKQIWFALRLVARESEVQLDCCSQPEFDCWRWVDFWSPLDEVIDFKRDVYRKALAELAPLVMPAGAAGPSPE